MDKCFQTYCVDCVWFFECCILLPQQISILLDRTLHPTVCLDAFNQHQTFHFFPFFAVSHSATVNITMLIILRHQLDDDEG